MKFYNTIGLDKDALDAEIIKAKKQEHIVLAVFKNSKVKYLTPSDVYLALDERYPITSIRRAMTNLTPEKLSKTVYQKPGLYGKQNYCWKLSK